MRVGLLLLLTACARPSPPPTDIPPPPPRAYVGPEQNPPTAPCPARPARLVFGSVPPVLDKAATLAFRPNLAASPDGKLVAVPTMEGRILLVDAAQARIRGDLVAHRGEARWLAFLDARTLASVGDDRVVRIWDLPAERQLASTVIDGDPSSLAASPADGSIVVGTRDGKLHLLDRAGAPRTTFEAHRRKVMRVAWKGDGSAFASVGEEGTVYRYDRTGGAKTLFHTLSGGKDALAFQPGTERIAIDWGFSDVVRLLSPDRSFVELTRWSDRVGSLPNADAPPKRLSFAFAPDGKSLAVSTCSVVHGFAARLAIVDVAADAAHFFDDQYGNPMTCPVAITWTPDGHRVVRISDHHSIHVIDPIAKQDVGWIVGQREQPFGARAARDRNEAAFEARALAALGTNALPQRDAACDALRTRFGRDARAFACTPARLFAGDFAGVHALDPRTGRTLGDVPFPPSLSVRRASTQLAVSPDGQSLGAWSEDGTVQVAGARPPCTMRIERHGIGAVTRFGWTPDGKHLVLFSGTTVRLLRVADGALLVSPRPAT